MLYVDGLTACLLHQKQVEHKLHHLVGTPPAFTAGLPPPHPHPHPHTAPPPTHTCMQKGKWAGGMLQPDRIIPAPAGSLLPPPAQCTAQHTHTHTATSPSDLIDQRSHMAAPQIQLPQGSFSFPLLGLSVASNLPSQAQKKAEAKGKAVTHLSLQAPGMNTRQNFGS